MMARRASRNQNVKDQHVRTALYVAFSDLPSPSTTLPSNLSSDLILSLIKSIYGIHSTYQALVHFIYLNPLLKAHFELTINFTSLQ